MKAYTYYRRENLVLPDKQIFCSDSGNTTATVFRVYAYRRLSNVIFFRLSRIPFIFFFLIKTHFYYFQVGHIRKVFLVRVLDTSQAVFCIHFLVEHTVFSFGFISYKHTYTLHRPQNFRFV